MPSLLYPNKYVETGTFIKHSESSTSENKEFMLPLVIGRGSKYLKQSETLRRGYIYQEQVSVSELYPNIFNTKYPFIKDKKLIQLWIDSQKISKEEWDIVDEYTIQLKQFTPNVSYFIDYQSSSNEVKDRFNLDVVIFESVGNTNGAQHYTEYEDFYLEYYLNNLKLNKESSDVLSFYDSYTSEYDYPIIQDYKGISSLEIIPTDIGNNILDISGIISRIEYDQYDKLSFIWLELESEGSKRILKINNDNKYYESFGLSFKIVNDDFHSTFKTKNGSVIEGDDYSDEISFKVIPAKTLIKGPARSITLNVAKKGNVEVTKQIQNVETEFKGVFNFIIREDSKNTSVSYTLSIDSFIIDGLQYNVVLSLFNGSYYEYYIIPVEIVSGKIYFVDDVVLTSDEGVDIYIYKRPSLVLATETDKGLKDEQGRIFIINNSGEVPFTTTNDKLVSFDYVCTTEGTSTVIYVTDTYSNKNEKVEILDFDNYYCFDSIFAKVYYDKIEEGDLIQFDIDKHPYISWNLTKDYEDSFTEVLVDYSGSISGQFSSKYVQLSSVPIDDIELISEEKFDYELIIKDNEAFVLTYYNGIPYSPRYSFSIKYRAKTKQPKVGSTYYVTATCIRPDSMYNTLIEVNSLQEGIDLIGPFDRFNDLYVANEIAWRELSPNNKYAYVQIKDSDNDGIITRSDVATAIDCLSKFKKATDIVMLNRFEDTDLLVDYNIAQNDPFQSNENKIWIGFPRNYSIEEMADYSNSILDMPFSDFRLMIANNQGDVNIDSIPITYRVDGSFIAWGMACNRRSESTEYASSLVKNALSSIDSMKTFSIDECRILGSNNISYIIKENDNYRIAEDLMSSGNIEQIIDQQIYASRYMRIKLDEIVGYTFDTPSIAIQTIQSKILSNLKQMISDGVISKYLTEDGVARDIDPSLDITVKKVEGNKTQYLFGFGFYTKKGIKHLFGTVQENC